MILAFPSIFATIQFEWEANAEVDPAVLKGSQIRKFVFDTT